MQIQYVTTNKGSVNRDTRHQALNAELLQNVKSGKIPNEWTVPSVLWYCWLGLLTCKNRLPYNLYCVGGDVKHCSIQSNPRNEQNILQLF